MFVGFTVGLWSNIYVSSIFDAFHFMTSIIYIENRVLCLAWTVGQQSTEMSRNTWYVNTLYIYTFTIAM